MDIEDLGEDFLEMAQVNVKAQRALMEVVGTPREKELLKGSAKQRRAALLETLMATAFASANVWVEAMNGESGPEVMAHQEKLRTLHETTRRLLASGALVDDEVALALTGVLACKEDWETFPWREALGAIADFHVRRGRVHTAVAEGLRHVREDVVALPRKTAWRGEMLARMDAALWVLAAFTMVEPGEVWVDEALAHFAELEEDARGAWRALFAHAAKADTFEPEEGWNRRAGTLVKKVGAAEVGKRLAVWFGRTAKRRNSPWVDTGTPDREEWLIFAPGNRTVLTGLAWMAAHGEGARLNRALVFLCEQCLMEIRGQDNVHRPGPRAVEVARAAVWALGERGRGGDRAARGALERLAGQVKEKRTLRAIAEALEEHEGR